MQHVRLTGLGVAAAGAMALWGCSGGGGGAAPTTPTAPTASTPSTVTVAIVSSAGNTAYQPNPVTAQSGDTVIFRNSDGAAHHIVMDDGSADLGMIGPGALSRGMTLRSASAATFHCLLHTSMVGSINGATAPPTPACPDPYGYGC